MTLKLLIIVVAAAAFGWGFSEIVEHASDPIRPDGNRYACDQWNGADCSRQFER